MVKKRKENQQFRDVVEEFRQTYNLKEPKCLSDTNYLYIRYIVYKLHNTTFKMRKTKGFGRHEEYFEDVKFKPGYFKEAEVYAIAYLQMLRGSEYIGNTSPKSIAAALVYIGCVMAGCFAVTQKIVAECVGTHDGAIRKHYNIIKKELKL